MGVLTNLFKKSTFIGVKFCILKKINNNLYQLPALQDCCKV